jgi:hypothetical protein
MPRVVVAVVTSESEAGKEDGTDDVHDAGDDHDPRRDLVEPAGFHRRGSRSSWCCCGGTPHGWGFWYFSHA